MLKKLFKDVKEAKANNEKIGREDYPALSIELFENGKAYDLRKKDLVILLQEAIYLLRDKDPNAEAELMEEVENYHSEQFED